MRSLTLAMVFVLFAARAAAPEDCMEDWFDDPCPIVINFDGKYDLTGAESPVMFDLLATGQPLLIGWTAAGADDAFLCLDRDENGIIDSGAELFGNAVMLANGSRARNGFVALSTFDENYDATLDEDDPVWPRLQLWRDIDHDGISQPAEITPLRESGVTAISLNHYWTGRRDASGNTFRYKSQVWISDGNDVATPRPVYDIFFVEVR